MSKKAIPLFLAGDVVSYPTAIDTTKTYLTGRAAKKTLTALQGGKTVVGTPLNVFSDTLTDALPTAFTGTRVCVSENGHKLHFNTSSATGVVICSLYDVNETTGVETYVGKIQLNLSSTTHTQRMGRLIDNGTNTGWRIIFGSIGASAPLGGLFTAENVDKADFVAGTPTIFPTATAAGQKAVYWHQETGGTNNLQVMQGGGNEKDAGLSGNKTVIGNGLVASPNFYIFDHDLPITSVVAGGITTNCYVLKSPTITGMAGTFLLLNNYSIAVPTADSGAPVSLQGQTCLFVPTSTNMGFIKISDITAIATTHPSYTVRDLVDVPNTNTAVTPATMHYSNHLQRAIMQLSSGTWVVKKFVNAQYELVFGSASDLQYRNLQPIAFQEFGAATVTSCYEHNGWVHFNSATAGQNGCMSFDLKSLYHYDSSSIISKVLSVPNMSFVTLSLSTPVRSFGKFFYKTSGFASPLTGWTPIPDDRDMTTILNPTGEIQIKIQPRMERSSSTIPLQIEEAYLIVDDKMANDDNWRFSFKDSSSGSPFKVAFAQQRAFTGTENYSITLYKRSNGAILAQVDTVTNIADFTLSTDNGSTNPPLAGPIASNPLNNVLTFVWGTPTGDEVDAVIRKL